MNPLVSVVIPTYNRGATIISTLDTVFRQDHSPVEIIVIDDGSTDDTITVLGPLAAEGRITLLRQPASGRPSTGRNKGLAFASGDIVFMFDSDDRMLPGKVSLTVEAFASLQGRSIGLCVTDFLIERPHTPLFPHLSRPYFSALRDAPKTPLSSSAYLMNSNNAYAALLAGNFVGTSSVAIPRAIIEAGYRFDERLTNSDDYDLWLRIVRDHDLLVLSSPLHVYKSNESGVLKQSILSGQKWRTNIAILERELEYIRTSEQRMAASRRLADLNRALAKSSFSAQRWSELINATFSALKYDPANTLRWLAGRLK